MTRIREIYDEVKGQEIPYLCYLFWWHTDCPIAPCWVGYPALWCPDHHCLIHVDLAGKHVLPEFSNV